MSDIDINNPESAERIIHILREGAKSEFWDIVCQELNRTKDMVTEKRDGKDLAELPSDEYKVMSEVFKNRIFDLTDLQELPETLIMELSKPEENEREPRFIREGIYPTDKDFLADSPEE